MGSSIFVVSSPPGRRCQGLRRRWKLHTWIWPVQILMAGCSLKIQAPRPGPVFRHRTGSGPGGLGAGIIRWQGLVWWWLTKICSLQIKARKLFHLLGWLTLTTIDDFARGAVDVAGLNKFEHVQNMEQNLKVSLLPSLKVGHGTLQSFLELRWSNSNFPHVVGSFLICFVHLHAVPLQSDCHDSQHAHNFHAVPLGLGMEMLPTKSDFSTVSTASRNFLQFSQSHDLLLKLTVPMGSVSTGVTCPPDESSPYK